MEGLIPFIYRTIKRRKTRRYYKCLSSGMAQRFDSESNFHSNGHKFLPPVPDKLEGFHEDHKTHRRYRSMEEFSSDLYSPEKYGDHRPRLAKDVRFGSRRMFACISGA
ncbi:hypothetical protein COCNU_01G021680 [Cocos nucifera]|uniref:Uncharacterized protein n=1 Tax=Cocos nucifera TaxID=13894 RepID=A0A8K0HXY2_COCNU|nr:hypothetical protein COCNU_01G021680 [Cocos nucifera]